MTTQAQLINYIKEARKKGYGDYQIKDILIKYNWPVNEVDEALAKINNSETKAKKFEFKNRICMELDAELLKIIEKRAKKNMFTISEQIEDIIRRSCVNMKKVKTFTSKTDDKLVEIFSREKRGKK